MRSALISIICAIAGCAPWPAVELAQPDEERAREIVWTALGADGPPPVVHWVAGAPCPYALDRRAILLGDGACLAGLYLSGRHTAEIVEQPRISDSSYVHELLHAAFALREGDPDPAHVRPEWRTVPAALNAQLRAEGL